MAATIAILCATGVLIVYLVYFTLTNSKIILEDHLLTGKPTNLLTSQMEKLPLFLRETTNI